MGLKNGTNMLRNILILVSIFYLVPPGIISRYLGPDSDISSSGSRVNYVGISIKFEWASIQSCSKEGYKYIQSIDSILDWRM